MRWRSSASYVAVDIRWSQQGMIRSLRETTVCSFGFRRDAQAPARRFVTERGDVLGTAARVAAAA